MSKGRPLPLRGVKCEMRILIIQSLTMESQNSQAMGTEAMTNDPTRSMTRKLGQ